MGECHQRHKSTQRINGYSLLLLDVGPYLVPSTRSSYCAKDSGRFLIQPIIITEPDPICSAHPIEKQSRWRMDTAIRRPEVDILASIKIETYGDISEKQSFHGHWSNRSNLQRNRTARRSQPRSPNSCAGFHSTSWILPCPDHGNH